MNKLMVETYYCYKLVRYNPSDIIISEIYQWII